MKPALFVGKGKERTFDAAGPTVLAHVAMLFFTHLVLCVGQLLLALLDPKFKDTFLIPAKCRLFAHTMHMNFMIKQRKEGVESGKISHL